MLLVGLSLISATQVQDWTSERQALALSNSVLHVDKLSAVEQADVALEGKSFLGME